MITEKLPDIEDMNDQQRKLFRTSKFLGKLLIAGAVFHLLLFIYPSTYGIQSWFAGFISGILNSLGINSSHSSYFVLLESGTYRITQDCLGWKSMAAFTGLIYASGSLKKNYRFLLTGIGVLAAANIVRVISTVYLSHTGIIAFEIIHGTLWKWGLTAVVLLLWIYWFRSQQELF